MWRNIAIACCILLVIVNTNALVRRDVSSPAPPNVISASIQRNLEQFRHCLDQSFATAVGDVNENQVKPVVNVLGDTLLKFSKAFQDITGSSTQQPDPDLAF